MASAVVGRADELDRLSDLVRGARDGRFGCVVVEGDAGIGKTTLVREACAAAGGDVLVLAGSCLPLTTVAVPLMGLRSAARSLPVEQRPLLPGSTVGEGDAAQPVPVVVDDWLDGLQSTGPVVLVVDDLQWADPQTLDVLTYVLAGPAERHLAVLLTVRSGGVPADHPVRGWLADARRLPGVAELVLDPLTRDEVGDLVDGLLGGAAHGPLVDEVHVRSGGNPYFARLLLEGVDPSADRLPAHLPDGLGDAAGRLLVGLSPDAQRLLVALAVSGRPAAGRALERVMDVADLADPESALREVQSSGVVDVGADGTVWFHHPVIAEVLEARVSPEGRILLHAGFAVGYEDDVEDGLTPVLAETISDHHLLAEQVEDAYDWALIAADAHDAAGDLVGVLRMLGRAVGLRPRVPGAAEPVADLLEDVRRAARLHGAWEEELAATEGLLQVVDVEEDPLHVAVLEAWRAILGFRIGRGQSVANLEHAVALSTPYPGTWQRVVILCEYSRLLLWEGEQERGRAAGLEAFRDAEAGPRHPGEDGDEWDRARAYAFGQRIMLATVAGEPVDAAALAERAYAAAIPPHEGVCILHATFWHANLLEDTGGDVIAVRRRGWRALEEAQAPRPTFAWLAAASSTDLHITGDVAGTVRYLREALGTGGGVTATCLARLTAASLAALQGRPGEAEAHLARAEELVVDWAAVPQFPGPTVAAQARIGAGEPRGAVDAALAGLRTEPHGTWCEWLAPLAARALADLVQADVDAGRDPAPRRAELRALREEFPRCLVDGNADSATYGPVLAGLDELYAAEAARAGVLDDAAARWDRAARMLHEASLPWDEAYARWRAGEALLVEGGAAARHAAAAHLRSGHALARRLGAVPVLTSIQTLARSARIRLDEVPGPDGTSSAGAGLLTPRERELLEHVVAGRTYAEIAEALFVSEKTVSSHISNILRKTGTANRVQLAAWAGRVDGG